MNKLFDHEFSLEGREVEVVVNNKMQKNYRYTRTMPVGDFSDLDGFKPELTPNEMLRLGVFEGKYLNDCKDEFPKSLFDGAKTSDIADPTLNFFKVKSRQPLSVWKKNGWIYKDDNRGFFQFYVRLFYGRRCPDDERQVKRWKSFVARHKAQLEKNCKKGDHSCRPAQRQALLQWGIDSRKL